MAVKAQAPNVDLRALVGHLIAKLTRSIKAAALNECQSLQAHGYPEASDYIPSKANPGRAYLFHVRPPVLRSMQAFVTVGSTKFDELIDAIASEDFLAKLSASGYTRLVVQYGNSKVRQPFCSGTSRGVEFVTWPFKPSLSEEYLAADLVISHAGGHDVRLGFLG